MIFPNSWTVGSFQTLHRHPRPITSTGHKYPVRDPRRRSISLRMACVHGQHKHANLQRATAGIIAQLPLGSFNQVKAIDGVTMIISG